MQAKEYASLKKQARRTFHIDFSFDALQLLFGLIFLTLIVVKEIKDHIEQIKRLCRTHSVKSLFAFGSVVSNTLKNTSDIDLLVDIDSKDPIDYSDNYFELKFQLESILKRPVDLLEDKSLKNPFLKKQIDNIKVLIYGR